MPTSDNLNEMSWSDRRRLDQEHFNALRTASQARINEQLRRGGVLPATDAITTAEAGAAFGPPSCDNVPDLPRATFAAPGRISVRDIHRTLDDAGIAHTPATGRAAQLVRSRSRQ